MTGGNRDARGLGGRRLEQEDGLPTQHNAVGAAVQADLAVEINVEHKHAQRDATNAIVHAVRCGELLLSLKTSLKHGEFLRWVKQNCEFTHRTATAYMRGARQIGSGFPISSLSSLFGPLHEKVAPADDADHDDGEHQRDQDGENDAGDSDHAGEQGVQQPDHVDDDNNSETAKGLQVQRELAGLLHAWAEASHDAREQFLAVKSVEISAIYRTWQRAA